jgi:hypothetical protein|mmetsp:Transcript_58216/g.138574  ORF Transcript_58216/g.138574 Transcript_58216/m.138574 type:complete len:383 (+) Transcript_58216:776-1924(+)
MDTIDALKIDLPLESFVKDFKNYKFFVRIKKNNISFHTANSFIECSIKYQKQVESAFLGELTRGLNFLIKVSCKNRTNMIFLIDIVKVVKKNLKFRRLVDFQLYSALSEHIETISSETIEIFTGMKSQFFKRYYNQSFPLDIIPPFFTTFSLRKNQIHLQKNKKKYEKTKKGPKFLVDKIKDMRIPIGLDRRSYSNVDRSGDPFINFTTDMIPTFPWKQIIKRYPLCLFAVGLIGKVFKKKPIWLKKNIEKYTPCVLKKGCKLAIKLFAYKFSKKTPFDYCWVRFGYDPRISVQSNIFQSFGIKDENFKTKPSSIKKKTGNPAKYKAYEAKKLIQLADIKSSFLKKFLKKDECLHKTFVHYKFGWFTEKGIRIIHTCKNISF